jgi:lipopolysaccharide/colanic/teichoic acid biosynthesis glycosyltransferase
MTPSFDRPARKIEVPRAQGLWGAVAQAAYVAFGKRMVDVALAIAVAPAVLPVVGIAAGAVALSGAKPFYAQERVGRHGRKFRCWKIRTMVPDADAVLARILAEDPSRGAEWATRQKLADDPRVTRVGRFLRRSSLDELPQIWNVLRGDMSFVGPRPFTPEQAAQYDGGRNDSVYYSLRPGLTGPWQLDGRDRSAFADRARFDAFYAAEMGLGPDLRMVLRTFGAVLGGRGS